MLGDAHWTNYAENRDFFLNQNNPTNFERTWETAYYLYKAIGKVDEQTPFDQVMDFSRHQEARQRGRSTPSRRTSTRSSSRPGACRRSRPSPARSSPRPWSSTSSPTRWDLEQDDRQAAGRQAGRGALRSQRGLRRSRRSGKLAGQYGASRIIIEGHTDALDEGPACPIDAVKRALRAPRQRGQGGAGQEVQAQPNQFSVQGMGWSKPGRPQRPQQPRQEPPRGDQGLPAREPVDRDGRRRQDRRAGPGRARSRKRAPREPRRRPRRRGARWRTLSSCARSRGSLLRLLMRLALCLGLILLLWWWLVDPRRRRAAHRRPRA